MHYLTQHLIESEPMQTSTGRQLPRRTILWHEAGKKCHWCGRATFLSGTIAPDQATIDHRIPRGRGGPDTRENCVSACRNCNEKRNHSDILSPGHRGPAPKITTSTTEDLVAALGEASIQRDSAVWQLNRLRERNQRYLADLQIFLNQRVAASR
jgi:5-methylcytosine-specific restriction endonuclease McrA